jgi:hypothetical protein
MRQLSIAVLISLLAASPARPESTPAASSGAPLPAAAPPCADEAHHQFDFWVGRWDVYGPRGRLVAHSLIEPVYGCGIRENWMPINGQPGGSLSIYVPAERTWQQFWIDASGSRVVFRGAFSGNGMILTGTWPASPQASSGPLVRMTYRRASDGSVRQFGERSTDEGHVWAPAFDFTYRPAVRQSS